MTGTEIIIYGVVFITVLSVVMAIYLAIFGRQVSANSRMNRRYQMIEKNGDREEVLNQLRNEMNRHVRARKIPIYSLLAEQAQRANITMGAGQLMMIMGLIAIGAFVALSVLTQTSVPIRLVASVGAGVAAVYLWVQNVAKKRMAAIEEQLPDAVDEVGFIADESAYGRDVGEALKAMAERLDMQDLRFLAVAVSIQQQSGGNLAEVLDGLAKVIRSRFKLFRRVKAITAEAQWSGKFLSGFPVLMIIAINVLKPDYYDGVKGTSVFIPACLVVAGMLAANMLVMRKLVNIKV